jgi:hypothetical protein
MSLRKEDALSLYLDDPSSLSRIREKGVDLKLSASCLSHPKDFSLALPRSQSKIYPTGIRRRGPLSLAAVTLSISPKHIDVILSFGRGK